MTAYRQEFTLEEFMTSWPCRSCGHQMDDYSDWGFCSDECAEHGAHIAPDGSRWWKTAMADGHWDYHFRFTDGTQIDIDNWSDDDEVVIQRVFLSMGMKGEP